MWRQEIDMNIAQFLGNNMAGGIVNKENDPGSFITWSGFVF
jgi:hypothetical protein